jgi:hypothetical protein
MRNTVMNLAVVLAYLVVAQVLPLSLLVPHDDQLAFHGNMFGKAPNTTLSKKNTQCR